MNFQQELNTKESVVWLPGNLWKPFEQYQEDFKHVIKQREEHRIPFQHQSPQLLFRDDLVNHLKEVAIKKGLSHSCLHLAVYLLDIFMDNHNIVPNYLLLGTNVCLLIAAKFEESAPKIPKISEINILVENRYPSKDYKSVEILILNFFLGYIMFPTAAHYTHYFMQAIISSHDLTYYSGNARQVIFDLHDHIKLYLDFVIDDVHLMQMYPPSKLAASILCAARIKVGLISWTKQLEDLTNYKFEQLQEPLADIIREEKIDCFKCQSIQPLQQQPTIC